MIATLSGIIAEKLLDTVVLDVHGVGYGVFISHEDHGALVTGQPSKVYIYEHIREQQHDLFAFRTLDSKKLFELFLSVNGVGPKMALSLMNVGTAGTVRGAIASGNLKFIQQANGVGKRVAERIVVELKDKVGLIGVDLEQTGMLQSESVLREDEAAEALIALGYSPQDAAQALKSIDSTLPVEARIKQALKGGK
jgi:Holliday junction DNA helicase RuvA